MNKKPPKSQPQPNKVILFRDEKYTEEDFIIPAQDTKGHSERIFVRCQPGHVRDLNVIVNSKRFPFKTSGDILRLAIKQMIQELSRMEPIPSVAQQVNTVIQLVRDEQFHQEFNECFDQIARSMDRYINGGAKDQARRLLIKIKNQFDEMPDGYWKVKYLKELGVRYKDYLHGVDLMKSVRTITPAQAENMTPKRNNVVGINLVNNRPDTGDTDADGDGYDD